MLGHQAQAIDHQALRDTKRSKFNVAAISSVT